MRGNLGLEGGAEMPWKTESVVKQRLEFLIDVEKKEETVTSLCLRYGVSRKTGYKWLKRYKEARTVEALNDRTRRPQRSPRRTSREREEKVLAVRDKKG